MAKDFATKGTSTARHAKDERKTLARELRRAAGLVASAAAIRDDAGKAEITAMMDIRAASGLEASVQHSAEEASQRYKRTFCADNDHEQREWTPRPKIKHEWAQRYPRSPYSSAVLTLQGNFVAGPRQGNERFLMQPQAYRKASLILVSFPPTVGAAPEGPH